ncbi:MAG: helix-turn-helix domain-containing protein [Mucilaginibacter sp.]|uniref:helix-turn-helix domain-containing protein n=1 Tax=Mucilaginibacter sp. TaxID=1882438 RepID=UPI0034E5DE74
MIKKKVHLYYPYFYPMPLPKKVLSRKDEITADFLRLFDQYVDDLLHQRATVRFHTSHFAAMLFIHPIHLTNTIKLTTGKSPCEIMEERLLEEAQKMLRQTEMSVADISYKLAYGEPTNFIKFYKSMTGTTPLRYRKALKIAALV